MSASPEATRTSALGSTCELEKVRLVVQLHLCIICDVCYVKLGHWGCPSPRFDAVTQIDSELQMKLDSQIELYLFRKFEWTSCWYPAIPPSLLSSQPSPI